MGRCSNRGSGPRSSPVRGARRPLPERPSSARAAWARAMSYCVTPASAGSASEPCGRAGHDRSCARDPSFETAGPPGTDQAEGDRPPSCTTPATRRRTAASSGRSRPFAPRAHVGPLPPPPRHARPCTVDVQPRGAGGEPAATSERSRSVGRASAMVRGLVGSRGGGMRRGHPRVGVASSKVCPATSYSPTTSRLQYHRR